MYLIKGPLKKPILVTEFWPWTAVNGDRRWREWGWVSVPGHKECRAIGVKGFNRIKQKIWDN